MTRAVAGALLALLASALLATTRAKCVGTAERPARELTLPKGGKFCLRLPRYLPNPEKALFGSNVFARTHNDTVRRASGSASDGRPRPAAAPGHRPPAAGGGARSAAARHRSADALASLLPATSLAPPRPIFWQCGLYSIVLHADDPAGVGPDPHVHYVGARR